MRFAVAVIGLLSALSSICASPANVVDVVERLRGVPEGWTQGTRAEPSTLIKFRLAVRQARAGEFEQMVLDMSTPSHPSYGKHMKRDELKSFLRPAPEVSEALLDWLKAEKVSTEKVKDEGDWISFTVPVGQAEDMLNTEFYHYRHAQSGVDIVRTLQYSVPRSIRSHVHMIQPTTRFGQIRPARTTIKDYSAPVRADSPGAFDPVFCNTTVTPDCLRGLYGLGNFTANPNVGNRLGISGYLKQWAQYAEFNQFADTYAPYLEGFNFSVQSINGGVNTQTSNLSVNTGEANLDVQYAISMAFNTPTTYYTTAGLGELIPDLDQPSQENNQNEPYLEQLSYLLSLPDDQLPLTLSTSYGEDEQSVPAAYANSTCSMFAQLGARGTSVIFSSGDTGVGSACQTNDGKNTTRFLPIFPAACPFVTSVGGVWHVEPEEAINFSSGGFSDLFPRPSYQDEVVPSYLNQIGDTFEGYFNPAGRGFPDVAAQSSGFVVYDHGTVHRIGGTSASAPTFAGIVTALNSIRLSQSPPLPPLGFLNPFLYSGGAGAQGFTDIVDGYSTGCTGRDQYSALPTPFVVGARWNATAGWDPVTGFGTPKFGVLRDLVLTTTGKRTEAEAEVKRGAGAGAGAVRRGERKRRGRGGVV